MKTKERKKRHVHVSKQPVSFKTNYDNLYTTREKNLMKLTPKQKKYIEFYVESETKIESAIRAGYSPTSAASSSDKNMKNPIIADEIDRKLKEKARKQFATTDDVMKFYTQLLKGEMEEEVVVLVRNSDGTTKPKIVNKKASIRDRGNAAKELSNILKITTNILQITQSNQNNVLTTIAEKMAKNNAPEDKDMVDFLEGDVVDEF